MVEAPLVIVNILEQLTIHVKAHPALFEGEGREKGDEGRVYIGPDSDNRSSLIVMVGAGFEPGSALLRSNTDSYSQHLA